jgi:hypothetical protein
MKRYGIRLGTHATRRRDVYEATKHTRHRPALDVWLGQLKADVERGCAHFWGKPHRENARPVDPVFVH